VRFCVITHRPATSADERSQSTALVELWVVRNSVLFGADAKLSNFASPPFSIEKVYAAAGQSAHWDEFIKGSHDPEDS